MRMKTGGGYRMSHSAKLKADGVLEVLVYGDIGENPWTGEGITAKSVKALMDAGQFSSVQLRINSPGGDAFEGVAIGNLLKSTGKPISVYVDGIAASAASIIAMCGNSINMAPNAMMMIHRAWTIGAGNTNDFTKLSNTLSKVDSAIGKTYADKTGKSVDEVMALMDAETWLSAEDCVSMGFAHAITEEDNPTAMAAARKFKALAQFKSVPDALKAEATQNNAMCECDCDSCLAGNCMDCSMEGCDDPNCTDCPMQEGVSDVADRSVTLTLKVDAKEALKDVKEALALVESAAEATTEQPSNLSLYEARLAMLRRKH